MATLGKVLFLMALFVPPSSGASEVSGFYGAVTQTGELILFGTRSKESPEIFATRDSLLIQNLGLNAYRLSISWNRILPSRGTGVADSLGVQHYRAVLQDLRNRGISTWVTLHHWDVPQYLQDEGGWLNSKIILDAFKVYAKVCFESFDDLVDRWITINEPLTMASLGFSKNGMHAPGRCTGCKAGDQNAAQRHNEFELGWFADPIFGGGDYPASMRANIGDRLPSFSAVEKKLLMKYRPDYFYINHYSSFYVEDKPHAANLPVSELSFDVDKAADLGFLDVNGNLIGKPSDVNWLYIVPQGLADVLKWIAARYNSPPIYITECGMADNSEYHDDRRIEYFEKYFHALASVIVNKVVDVRGFFTWSLLDNFEWADGFETRFGLYFVNASTDPVTVHFKKSTEYFRAAIHRFRNLPVIS